MTTKKGKSGIRRKTRRELSAFCRKSASIFLIAGPAFALKASPIAVAPGSAGRRQPPTIGRSSGVGLSGHE